MSFLFIIIIINFGILIINILYTIKLNREKISLDFFNCLIPKYLFNLN